MINEDGYIQLADFGLGSEIKDEKIKDYAGTICYMAPEIFAKKWLG